MDLLLNDMFSHYHRVRTEIERLRCYCSNIHEIQPTERNCLIKIADDAKESLRLMCCNAEEAIVEAVNKTDADALKYACELKKERQGKKKTRCC